MGLEAQDSLINKIILINTLLYILCCNSFMTTKQEKLYKSVLLEVHNSEIDLKYNGYMLNNLTYF